MSRRRTYRPEYPFTLLAEALDLWRSEVIRDDEARNKFLIHIQPLVRHCTARTARSYSDALVRKIDDVVGFVNVKLLESWLPRYLASERKVERVREAVRYLTKSIHGYVLDYIKQTYDPREVPFGLEISRPPSELEQHRSELHETLVRMVDEHVALRPRPDLDVEVVRRLMRHLAWKEYVGNDGVPDRQGK